MIGSRLILASGSETRRAMLRAAGLVFDVEPARIDEAALRQRWLADDPSLSPAEIASALASAKARDVGVRHPVATVIGSDQVLECDGEIFEKPESEAGARRTLLALGGRTHLLHSAAAVARGEQVLWSICDTARLTMRPLSPASIDAYLAGAGDGIFHSVGAYQIEGLGIQLFEDIAGDYHTILGMPLLPLLNALRAHGALAA